MTIIDYFFINGVDKVLQLLDKDYQNFREAQEYVYEKNNLDEIKERVHRINLDILLCHKNLKYLNFDSNQKVSKITIGSGYFTKENGFSMHECKKIIEDHLEDLETERSDLYKDITSRIDQLSKIIIDFKTYLNQTDRGIVLDKIFQPKLAHDAEVLHLQLTNLLEVKPNQDALSEIELT